MSRDVESLWLLLLFVSLFSQWSCSHLVVLYTKGTKIAYSLFLINTNRSPHCHVVLLTIAYCSQYTNKRVPMTNSCL